MTNETLRLGDTVSASYGPDLVVVGRIVAFASGGVELEFSAPVEILGSMRDGVFVSRHWRDTVVRVEQ